MKTGYPLLPTSTLGRWVAGFAGVFEPKWLQIRTSIRLGGGLLAGAATQYYPLLPTTTHSKKEGYHENGGVIKRVFMKTGYPLLFF